MTDPKQPRPHHRPRPARTTGRCSAPTGVAGHRMTIPPPPVRLGQLQLLAPRLRPPPQPRLRITRHRIHLSPRENRTVVRQHRKLNRRVPTLAKRPTQNPPHPMRPPPRALNNPQRRDTKPLPRPVRLGWTPGSHTQCQPRLQPRRIPRRHTPPIGNRRASAAPRQPTHRSALPPGLHTTRDLLQLKRHTPTSGELTQRRHHPPRSQLRPRRPRHTPSMRSHPDNPTPNTPDPDRPKVPGPSGGRGAAPNPGTTSESRGKITGLVVSSRRGQALPDGRPLRARETPPLRSGPTARQPHGGAARRQPATPPECAAQPRLLPVVPDPPVTYRYQIGDQ
jgi:hypothetical protein